LGHYFKGKIRTIFCTSDEPPTEEFTGKIFLCKIENGNYTPLLSNPKSVGKPRTYLIRGQDIYNGYLDPFSRGKVMDAIKNCYMKYVKNIPVITEYPVKIEVEFHHTIHNPYDKGNEGLGQQWDIDNFVYLYMKAFPDLLVKLGKLKNDDRLHITQPPHAIFFPIEDASEMKFVFIISKDDRPEIVNNETFKSYHKNKNTYETEDSDLCKDDEPFGSVGKMTEEDLEETIKIFKNPEEDGSNKFIY